MVEYLTENELRSWQITLSTLRSPTEMYPDSGYWLRRFLDTIAMVLETKEEKE